MNLATILYKKGPKNKKVFLYFNQQEYTFEDAEKRSSSIANYLQANGIKPDDKVAIISGNRPEFIFSYFGILKVGGVVVPVNPLLTPFELSYILEHSDTKFVIYDDQLKPKLQHIKINSLAMGQISSLEYKPFIPLDRNDHDVVAILYTSGTTGRPKGAMLTHKNLLSNIKSVSKAIQCDEKDKFILVLPLFHSFGATVGMLTPINLNASIILLPRFTPESVLESISKQKGTVFLGVPSMFSLLSMVKEEEIAGLDLSSWRFCISGGAPLPTAVLEAFERKYGVMIYEGDGPTECSPVTSVNPIGGKRKIGSIGTPIPDVKMAIMDDNCNLLPPGSEGEIVVKGPNVFKGYYKDEQATKESFCGEYFRTGDIGKMDEEGYFYIIDRKKDMIIVNGMNVYPREIEELLYKIDGIKEAACIGKPHHLHGEIPVCYIVIEEGKKVDIKQINQELRKYLAPYKVPRSIEIVESLLKTSTGKISKVLLREKVLGKQS